MLESRGITKTATTGVIFDSVHALRREINQFLRTSGPAVLFFAASFSVCASLAFYGPVAFAQETAPPNFESLTKSATESREAGRTDDAVRDYKRAVQLRVDWEEGWWYLGTLQYDTDRFAEAIPALERVVQLDPANGPAWNFLGLCEFETREYQKSLEHLQKGQALGTGDDPEIARVSKYHLALLLNRDAEFEKASAMLASAFGDQAPAEVKVALGLLLLRVPLLPQEVDPSQDALIQAAGETASIRSRGDAAKTIDSFRTLLQKYPNVPYLHYAFGLALASAKRDDEALLQQRAEVRTSPQSALPWVEISASELLLHHPQEALRAAEQAVKLASDSSAAHRALALSLQALGQKQKAAFEARAAEALAPEKRTRDTHIVQIYAHRDASVSPIMPAVANASIPQSSNFDELSHQAESLQAAGKSDEAIRAYQQALQLRPEWDEGRWNLAMTAYSTGHYTDAIEALKICVARKPSYGTAWAVMGLSEFEVKDYNNALIHLQRGQDLGMGGSAESVQLARYRLAILLNRNSEFDRATELLTPEADHGPLAKEVRFALGMALLRIPLLPDQVDSSKSGLMQSGGEIAVLLQASKYDEVFPKFQALLRQYPGTPFLHYAYGTAFAALSQYDDAEAELRKEISISPKSELPHVRLASIALRTHRPEDALPSAQHAVQLAPDSAEAHYLLGRSCLELGQGEKAVQELETARKLAPASPEVHFNLAKAYSKANLPEKADQERAAFARLNALAEQQRSHRGNQSYSGSHDKTDFLIPRVESESAPTPDAH